MKSTMGLSPIVQRSTETSVWLTEEGKAHFVQIVKSRVESDIGTDIHITDTCELHNILIKTIVQCGQGNVDDAVAYAVHMLKSRVLMHTHLQSIRENSIRLQPRGCDDREKGCLPMAEVRNSGSNYARFLEQQQKYRK